jgi:hypothetical protein
MNNSEDPQAPDRKGLSFLDYANVAGWLLWLALALYFACRGLTEGRRVWVTAGLATVVVSITFTALILLKPAGIWPKVVRWLCLLLILLTFLLVLGADLQERNPGLLP